MYRFITFLIRPLMRLWSLAAVTSWNVLPKPPGVAGTHAPGPDHLRILLVGAGPAVGFGVLSHDLALSGNFARLLSAAMGRGVDVDTITDPVMTARTALDAIDEVKLSRYDAVVLMVGLYESLQLVPASEWCMDVDAFLSRIERSAPARLRTFVVEIQPLQPNTRMLRLVVPWIVNRHVERLNDVLRRACSSHPSTTIVPFQPPANSDAEQRNLDIYRAWAGLLIDPISTVLMSSPGSRHNDPDYEDEEKRQRSLERLGILDTEPEERFTRIAAIAQRLFGTAAAALTFVDGDRQWFKARIGFSFTETPRNIAFCDHTIRQDDTLVVPDSSTDARFENNALVIDESNVRFYAGHPIVTPNGERVGALCVFDTRPRGFSEADKVLLRNLARMVQDELWADHEARALR